MVQIAADRQSYDAAQAKSFFNGRVKVSYQGTTIEGQRAVVDMDPKGRPLLATFPARPKAHKRAKNGQLDRLEADTIRIDLIQNALRAEGTAVSTVTSVASDPFLIRSDVQQFDNVSKTVVAMGTVRVDYKDTKVASPRAVMQVDAQGKAEKVVFMGGARLEKPNGVLTGDKVTVLVASGNLVAEKNVLTEALVTNQDTGKPAKVIILSDVQQYDKASDTMLASGNVRLSYEDYRANGPKAVFKLKNGQLEQMVFTGRSAIADKDHKVIADRIVITTNPKHFDASGNVKTEFVGSQGGEPTSRQGSGSRSAGKTSTVAPAQNPKGLKPLTTPQDFEE